MEELWFDGDGNYVSKAVLISELRKYTDDGGKIYIGTDSQEKPEACVLATAT